MNYSNRTKNVKSSSTTILNLHNKINEKMFVTHAYLYCNTCGKNIQKNPVLCYIFIDYFCSTKCHVQKHEINQNM